MEPDTQVHCQGKKQRERKKTGRVEERKWVVCLKKAVIPISKEVVMLFTCNMTNGLSWNINVKLLNF